MKYYKADGNIGLKMSWHLKVILYIYSNKDIDTRTLNGFIFGLYLRDTIEYDSIKLRVIFEVEKHNSVYK